MSPHPEQCVWGRPPAAPEPTCDEIHVWSVRLDRPAWRAEELVRVLSADEVRRADAFAYARERRRFVVSRVQLRRLLARYLGVDPAAVDFTYGPHGKPELAHGHGPPALRFSCSHSGAVALYAVTAGRRVGVDVEALRPLPEAAGIAELCFSPRERAALDGVPRDALERAVLRSWTLKEAYLKATGEGLSVSPDRVEVAVAPDAPAALQAVGGDARAAVRWSLRSFDPLEGYTAALAAEGRAWRQRCWALEPDTDARREHSTYRSRHAEGFRAAGSAVAYALSCPPGQRWGVGRGRDAGDEAHPCAGRTTGGACRATVSSAAAAS